MYNLICYTYAAPKTELINKATGLGGSVTHTTTGPDAPYITLSAPTVDGLVKLAKLEDRLSGNPFNGPSKRDVMENMFTT